MRRIRDLVVAEEALRLVRPIATDKRRRLLRRKARLHFVRKPLVHVSIRIVQQRLRRRRHRVELGRRKLEQIQRRGRRLRPRPRLRRPGRSRAKAHRLAEHRRRRLPHTRNLAHRRGGHQPLLDQPVQLRRGDIPALRLCADIDRLDVQPRNAAVIALPQVSAPRRLVLGISPARILPDRRPRLLQR